MIPDQRELQQRANDSYQRAWETARRNFGGDVSFHAPSLKRYSTTELEQSCDCSFVPLSITGDDCELMCDHCRGRILSFMNTVRTPGMLLAEAERLSSMGAKGVLVSGGSEKGGVVPLRQFAGALGEIKQRLGLKVLVHTGITSPRLAADLAAADIDGAMIDIIGSEEAIRDICHMQDVGVAAYERSLENLVNAGVPVSPHVVIGLEYGAVGCEASAIEMISGYPVSALVLVGLLPMNGTPMEGVKPPSPQEFGELFVYARQTLPRTPVLLGCERPAGEHKRATDSLALRAGLNGIAYPSEGVIAEAREMGLNVNLSEMCCALIGGGQMASRAS